MELRPEVQSFAEAMEMKLRKYDEIRPGWKGSPEGDLMREAWRHMAKLEQTLDSPSSVMPDTAIALASADVANYLMMVCDNRGALWTRQVIQEQQGLRSATGERVGGGTDVRYDTYFRDSIDELVAIEREFRWDDGKPITPSTAIAWKYVLGLSRLCMQLVRAVESLSRKGTV